MEIIFGNPDRSKLRFNVRYQERKGRRIKAVQLNFGKKSEIILACKPFQMQSKNTDFLAKVNESSFINPVATTHGAYQS